MGIYERIQALCVENNVSLRRLERDLGFGNSTIAKWKTSAPSIDKLQLVAEYFNVSVESITSGDKSASTEKYYLNDETAKIAQKIFENKELRLLFDAAEDAPAEDLQTVHSMLLALKRKEKGYND